MSHQMELRCRTHTHLVTDDGCPERGCEDVFHGWSWAPHGSWCPADVPKTAAAS